MRRAGIDSRATRALPSCLLLGEDRRGDERIYTQAFADGFKDDAQVRSEFMRAIGRR